MRVGAMQQGLGVVLVITVALTGCATPGKSSRARFCDAVGSLAGAAAAGAVVGAAAGPPASNSDSDNAAGNAMAIGAAVGLTTGAVLHTILCNRQAEPAPKPKPPAVRPAATAPEPAPAVTKRIVLRGVHFDFDRAAIKPEAEAVLFQAAEILKRNPELRIQVAGYTDSTGSAVYNQGLSERRASAVKGWLVTHGIAPGRLDSVGYGESMPVADNTTEAGRIQNRRVELNVLK
ncbi:MAG: OmpA family protein [Myxococcales bacterium]|nr:OmpA family protein [Myxococcales bacterium]